MEWVVIVSNTFKCDYCKEVHEQPTCSRKVQFDVLQAVSQLERQVIEPDEKDAVGINKHLRVVWGFRDWLNDYFNAMRTDDE